MFFCLGGYAIGMYLALHGPLDGNGIPRCLFVVTSEVSGFQLPIFWKPFQYLTVALLLGILIPADCLPSCLDTFSFRSRVRASRLFFDHHAGNHDRRPVQRVLHEQHAACAGRMGSQIL